MMSTETPEAPRPAIERGRQVINRADGETWEAHSFDPHRATLRVRRIVRSNKGAWEEWTELPIADVAIAGMWKQFLRRQAG